MQSSWNNAEARRFVREAEERGEAAELGLRVYSSRLIGRDPDLVLHGGGNTSVKLDGHDGTKILHIKGSGWDLETIESPGLPAVRLEPLLAKRDCAPMSDSEMVALLRANLLDANAPTPSVEALLHAFLPHAYVDHCHASAILALADQPDMRESVKRLYGVQLAYVPYVMPGYDLSIEADRVYREAAAGCEGLWLQNHGLFTFGETARESYERMVKFVTIAEEELTRTGAALDAPERSDREADPGLAERIVANIQRLGEPFASRVELDFRSTPTIRAYASRSDLDDLSHRGTVTPDHVIRVKPFPLIVEPDASSERIAAALDAFAKRYSSYFERNARRAKGPLRMLDPIPRVVLIRGQGLFGIGSTEKAASIAADLAEQTARIVPSAEAYGSFRPLDEDDLFDMEYWELEQAKLTAPNGPR